MVAVLQPTGKGKLIPVDRAVVLVGRSADCDAVITHSQKISRKHCCLVQADDRYFVRDLGSMNGVWLNGKRVTQEALLTGGDKLSIGDVEFLFHPNAKIESRKPVVSADSPAVQDADAPRRVVLIDETEGSAAGRTPVDDDEIIEVLDDEIIDLDDGPLMDSDDAGVAVSVEELEAIADVDVIHDLDFGDEVEVLDEASSAEVEIVEIVDDIVIVDDDDLEILDEVEVIRPGRSGRAKPVGPADDEIISIDDDDLLIFDDED
ncbi:MAG: FHA domain-containing protein [Planctomycetaceae bacterium]